ncbi:MULTISPECIES: DUF3068 domain-containing protein [unclassified Gordonia (in: high G+C Gram-positive bacteria)]|uniref:DUF3068 domain-containing protein n=1 Tax=unclassified Gordonia (in: high G+C Gram-positive bacteria) TaxID=2657482 RepID=UPI001FFF0783|nr:DUF3068 domain-containing protein [Gordonia sp. PP30]UQE74977.1 DUF3068 domain-containing protein [Gordonia sp. PP30]
MRRFWMALLAFLGLACIAAAITIPTYLVPKLKVVPLDLDITSDASSIASGGAGDRFPAVIFDRCSIAKSKAAQLHVNLKQQRRSIIVEPSNAEQATLQSAQTVLVERIRDADGQEKTPSVAPAGEERKCDDGLLTASIDHVSVDRKTSVPNGKVSFLQMEAPADGESVKDVSVPLENRKGFQYKFGFGVEKRNYYYYDLNTRQDTVASFVDEKTIDGLKVYHFKTEVPETDLSDLPNPQGEAALGTILTMPAKWWGITGRGIKPNTPVTMHRYASAVREVWVEPATGTIVDGLEAQHQYFKSPDDPGDVPAAVTEFRMDALKADFKWSDTTVAEQVKRADHYRGLLKLGGTTLPIVLGVVGALLLAVWGLLLFRGRRRGDDGTGGDGGSGPDLAAPVDDDPTAAAPQPEPGPGAPAAAFAAAPTAADEYWAPPVPGGEPEIDDTVDTIVFDHPLEPAAPADEFRPLDNPIAAIPVDLPPEEPTVIVPIEDFVIDTSVFQRPAYDAPAAYTEPLAFGEPLAPEEPTAYDTPETDQHGRHERP